MMFFKPCNFCINVLEYKKIIVPDSDESGRRIMEKPISWECLMCGRSGVWPVNEGDDPRIILEKIRQFHRLVSRNFLGFECAGKLVVFISDAISKPAAPKQKETVAPIDIHSTVIG
jgi:hypothetical protein